LVHFALILAGLPLDNDQGTNFLDEHELHEMLNKMADEAFELSAGRVKRETASNKTEDFQCLYGNLL